MFHVIERYFDEVAVRGERQANMLSLTYPPQDRGCAFAHVISQNVQQLLQGHRRGTCIPFSPMEDRPDLQPPCSQQGHTQGRKVHASARQGVSHLLIPDPGVQHMIGCKHQAGNLQEQTGRSVLNGG